jgi:hypothetical protein
LETDFEGSKESKDLSEDSINDSDIMYTRTSINKDISKLSDPMNISQQEMFGSSGQMKQSKKSEEVDSQGSLQKSKSWKMSDMSESLRTMSSFGKKSGSLPLNEESKEIEESEDKDEDKGTTSGSSQVKNIHAPKSSSIFSQNHINNATHDALNKEKQFFSRQVSIKEQATSIKMKKSKTFENQEKPPQMLMNVLSPKKDYNLMDLDLKEMVMNRNIMDTKIPSNRSNLNNILKNKNAGKYNKNKAKGGCSEKLDSIKESSMNSGKDKHSSNKKSSSNKKNAEIGTMMSQSLSHFQFEDHKNSEDPFTVYSKDDMSKASKTDDLSDLSGLQHLVNNRLSENKEFLSGVGSLNNLTQYIDFPYLNISKHASRLSKDFQTQDNISLLKDDIFQKNLEEYTKRTGRLSIENFFSNIKKNQNFELIPDSKLESIQGPYFTGQQSEKNISLNPLSSISQIIIKLNPKKRRQKV